MDKSIYEIQQIKGQIFIYVKVNGNKYLKISSSVYCADLNVGHKGDLSA